MLRDLRRASPIYHEIVALEDLMRLVIVEDLMRSYFPKLRLKNWR
jgi:hypothetical protein